jgi:hypothetical protein
MTFNGIKATATAAAVLIAASLGGQALAQPPGGGQQPSGQRDYHQGGDYGDRNGPSLRDQQQSGDRDFGDRNFNDREFDQRGRFYYGGETRQRIDKIEQWARYSVRSGRLTGGQADRVFTMLQSIRQQARAFRRDGVVTPRERMILNSRIDDTVRYLRGHMIRGPHEGGRRY